MSLTNTDPALSEERVAEAIREQPFPPRPNPNRQIDKTRWRMKNVLGRQTWVYLDDDEAAKEWPLTEADRWYLGLPRVCRFPVEELFNENTFQKDAAVNGLTYYEKLQQKPGNWACEYGGPMFLLPGLVITWYITKTTISDVYATEIKNYLFARAHPEDGGWGLHIEGESTVFGTLMNYIALRLVGVGADEPQMVRARATLHKLGGGTRAPHWGKFWLAILGVATWDLVNPIPAEIWLVPDWVPFAPWRWWVHVRAVFLPMSYLYSKRWTCQETDVIRSLRDEVFPEPWSSIDWAANRNSISPVDNYHPKSWLLNSLNWVLYNVWNPIRPKFVSKRAEDWVSTLVDMEDANTDYSCLAPVNAPINTLVCYVRDGPGSYSVRRHIERLEDYLWVNHEGMLANGTNGLQNWDTAFTIQTIVASGLEKEERYRPLLTKALEFLESQQIREDCVDTEKCYRHPRKGAWGFSNKDQGYAVSDCISEALKSVVLLQKSPYDYPRLLDDRRIFDAVDTLLLYQNEDTGGCASYELRRGGEWLEMLNAAEVFGRIMVDYDYPECTTSCVTALSLFRRHWPDYRSKDIEHFIERAVAWIKRDQRPDGSWYGSWGICFTYAAFFALESLAYSGETYSTSNDSRAGCEFLLSKQREDGGWSESYRASETMEWHEHPFGSLVVQTSWAVIALMEADYPHLEPIKKAIQFLVSRQQPNGEWKQEAIEGVFNKSCMISYPNYKFIFPIRALGMFAKKYPNEAL